MSNNPQFYTPEFKPQIIDLYNAGIKEKRSMLVYLWAESQDTGNTSKIKK